MLKEVDRSMAKSKAQMTLARLDWIDDGSAVSSLMARAKEAVQKVCRIARIKDEINVVILLLSKAAEVILDGTLRNNRGTKLEVNLLDTVLILGRPSSRCV